MFAYCNNNPINLTDYCGNAPGDWFLTPDYAAKDFANYINEQSIQENREYASYIYAVEVMPKWLESLFLFLGMDQIVNEMSGKIVYTYKEPQRGTVDSSQIPTNWFQKDNMVALIHTHAAYDPAYMNDVFSPTDIQLAARKILPMYAATPLGTLRKYDPTNDTDVIISYCIPFDPNHPLRRNE